MNMNPLFPGMGGPGGHHHGNMSPALLDIKPDISKLTISANSHQHGGPPGFGGPLGPGGGLGYLPPGMHDPYAMSRGGGGGPLGTHGGYGHMGGGSAHMSSPFGMGLVPPHYPPLGMHPLSGLGGGGLGGGHGPLQQSSSNPLPTTSHQQQARQSPTSTVGMTLFSPGSSEGNSASSSAANQQQQALAASKHLCAICGDRASGKHYGVYSCEGCKGFFKRTVRKELQYACRDDKNCLIDKRQRNRCQYCRYIKCLNMGMKREAVQEERQRTKERDGEMEGKTNSRCEMPVEKILKAEQLCESRVEAYLDDTMDMASRHLFALIEWARRVPHFAELPLDDQIVLLQTGWNELLIASFAYRSTTLSDTLVLSSTLHVQRAVALQMRVDFIFDRIITELVVKMREMNLDQTEIGCLRAVVLFNPDAKGLVSPQQVEMQRERVYASLEDYCKTAYPDEPGRFAKLLLRLPALRSVGLKCIETRFFFKLFGDRPVDNFIVEMLEMSN